MISAAVSLGFLVLTVVVANWRKVNVGLVALAAAAILGLLYGLKIDTVLAGFNLELVIRMFAVQLLVVISRENGTLRYVAQKLQAICRGQAVRIFPIILYTLMLGAELLGFNVHAILLPVLAAIAFSLRMEILPVVVVGELTMFAGCFSPYSVPGIMFYGYVTDAGLAINRWNIPALCMISYTALFVFFYFYYGWHKVKVETSKGEETTKMNRASFLTLCAYFLIVVANLLFKVDLAISASICALLLLLCKAADPEKAIRGVPYSILVMMGGMTTLIGVVAELGGTQLISSAIAAVPNKVLAPSVLTVLAGVMSIFSSASGVVQPTLVASIPNLMELMPGVSAQSLASGIAVGSYAVAMSPFDASGPQILAAYGAVYNPSEESRQKLFNKLLKLTVFILLYQSLLALVGFYQIRLL